MIKYLPSKLLKSIAPDKKIQKLVTQRLTVNKAALSFLDGVDFLSKQTVERTALKTIKQYKQRFKDEPETRDDVMEDKSLLVNRVQNTIINEIAGEIKDAYRGEFYKWLPSDADVPDPLHALKYGKKFQIGKGEMPGERYGCKCGMAILVSDTKLDL
jgi:hypothetical protein